MSEYIVHESDPMYTVLYNACINNVREDGLDEFYLDTHCLRWVIVAKHDEAYNRYIIHSMTSVVN